jgi:hydrogenase maturation protein HypF
VRRIGLSGGVFQNRVLTERAQALLMDEGFEVLIPQRLPVNDAGISYGQLIEAAAVHGAHI